MGQRRSGGRPPRTAARSAACGSAAHRICRMTLAQPHAQALLPTYELIQGETYASDNNWKFPGVRDRTRRRRSVRYTHACGLQACMCASEQTAFGGSDILVTDRPLVLSL